VVERIRGLCKKKNITIAELERRCGIGNGIIARWGKSKPSYDRLLKVAEELETTVHYLQTGEQSEKPTSAFGDGLSKDEAKLLALFRQVPEESQQMVTGMIEAALKNLGLLE